MGCSSSLQIAVRVERVPPELNPADLPSRGQRPLPLDAEQETELSSLAETQRILWSVLDSAMTKASENFTGSLPIPYQLTMDPYVVARDSLLRAVDSYSYEDNLRVLQECGMLSDEAPT